MQKKKVHVAFYISGTTFQCFFYTRASQHLFVAQQAVMWAAVFGRESAIISTLYLQPFQCSGQDRLHGPKSLPPPTSALQPCARAPSVLGTVGAGARERLQGWLKGMQGE